MIVIAVFLVVVASIVEAIAVTGEVIADFAKIEIQNLNIFFKKFKKGQFYKDFARFLICTKS